MKLELSHNMNTTFTARSQPYGNQAFMSMTTVPGNHLVLGIF